MAQNMRSELYDRDILEYLVMSPCEPSHGPADFTDPLVSSSAHNTLLANATSSSLSGLGSPALQTFNEVHDSFELPWFVTASAPSSSTSSGATSAIPASFNAYNQRQNAPHIPRTTPSFVGPSTHLIASQRAPRSQNFIVQQTSSAKGARQIQTPRSLPSPCPLNFPNASFTFDHSGRTPTTPNMTSPQYNDSFSPPMCDLPVYSPMQPPTPTISRMALSPGMNQRSQQTMGNMVAGSAGTQQALVAQASIDTERERQLHQQRILMMRRIQQQQASVGQSPNSLSHIPQASFLSPQLQPSEQAHWNRQQIQQSRSAGYIQPNSPVQTISPGMLSMAANQIGNAQSSMKRQADEALKDSSSKRVRMAGSGQAQSRIDLNSPPLQHNVLVRSGGSYLPCNSPTVNVGRQYSQMQPQTHLQAEWTRPPLQQHPSQIGLIQSTSHQQRDIPVVSGDSASRKRKVSRVQSDFRTPSESPSSRMTAPDISTTKEWQARERFSTLSEHSQARQSTPVNARPNQRKFNTSAPTQTPTTTRLTTPSIVSSPPSDPSHTKSDSEPLSDDAFASMLRRAINNTKSALAARKPQEYQTLFLESPTLLLSGPLTKEQNSKALVQGVKNDMKKRGPSIGTNPDLDIAAAPHLILEQQRTWTEEFKRDTGLGGAGGTYIPACMVMKSATGYASRW